MFLKAQFVWSGNRAKPWEDTIVFEQDPSNHLKYKLAKNDWGHEIKERSLKMTGSHFFYSSMISGLIVMRG